MKHSDVLRAFLLSGYNSFASHFIYKENVPYIRHVGTTLTPSMKEILKRELGDTVTFEDGDSIANTGTLILG